MALVDLDRRWEPRTMDDAARGAGGGRRARQGSLLPSRPCGARIGINSSHRRSFALHPCGGRRIEAEIGA
jgi:hypothetical protein